MLFAGNRSHAIPLFVSANVLPSICFILKQYVLLCTTYLPILHLRIICDLFTCASDVHTYNTRFSDAGNLYVNKSRLSIQLNSFSIFGAKLWNCLKPDLHKLRKKSFKNKIHQFLLAVLGNEEGCGFNPWPDQHSGSLNN